MLAGWAPGVSDALPGAHRVAERIAAKRSVTPSPRQRGLQVILAAGGVLLLTSILAGQLWLALAWLLACVAIDATIRRGFARVERTKMPGKKSPWVLVGIAGALLVAATVVQAVDIGTPDLGRALALWADEGGPWAHLGPDHSR